MKPLTNEDKAVPKRVSRITSDKMSSTSLTPKNQPSCAAIYIKQAAVATSVTIIVEINVDKKYDTERVELLTGETMKSFLAPEVLS